MKNHTLKKEEEEKCCTPGLKVTRAENKCIRKLKQENLLVFIWGKFNVIRLNGGSIQQSSRPRELKQR